MLCSRVYCCWCWCCYPHIMMRNLRLRNANQLIQGHRASEWQTWDSCHLPTSPLSVPSSFPPNLFSGLAELFVVSRRHQTFPFLCALVEAVTLLGEPYLPAPLSGLLSPTHHLRTAWQLLLPGNPPNPQTLLMKLNAETFWPFFECATTMLFLDFRDMIFPLPKTVFIHMHRSQEKSSRRFNAHLHVHACTCTHTHAYQSLLP